MISANNRIYTREFVYNLLESVKGKTLGEIDKSHQFARTKNSSKITGIAGDVIEQSVFGYERDSNQECDLKIDGVSTELKTLGVRIPKSDLPKVKGKTGDEYNLYLRAKEGITITAVTLGETIQIDFLTSHFWEKAEHLLFVFYEYSSYESVPASAYSQFKLIDYCFNQFTTAERDKLRADWEIVRDYLKGVYDSYDTQKDRYAKLNGFTRVLRPQLLLIELVPAFKKKSEKGSYQKPRYRLKQTFVDYLVQGHFKKSGVSSMVELKKSFSSFAELDARCHDLTSKYSGMSFNELKVALGVETEILTKDFGSRCILKMFDAECRRLNQISDFTKAGIIAKTITLTPKGGRTEDVKLGRINFDEWSDRDVDFEQSEIFTYFSEHSFLCPVFCERGDTTRKVFEDKGQQAIEDKRVAEELGKTTFEGFKRFAFDEDFIENEVQRMWNDSRRLIHSNQLKWEYVYDSDGNPRMNKSGAYMGAPDFPKSSEYQVFFRGGSSVSNDKTRTEVVNGIRMLPQFFWLRGSFMADKLKLISYL